LKVALIHQITRSGDYERSGIITFDCLHIAERIERSVIRWVMNGCDIGPSDGVVISIQKPPIIEQRPVLIVKSNKAFERMRYRTPKFNCAKRCVIYLVVCRDLLDAFKAISPRKGFTQGDVDYLSSGRSYHSAGVGIDARNIGKGSDGTGTKIHVGLSETRWTFFHSHMGLVSLYPEAIFGA